MYAIIFQRVLLVGLFILSATLLDTSEGAFPVLYEGENILDLMIPHQPVTSWLTFGLGMMGVWYALNIATAVRERSYGITKSVLLFATTGAVLMLTILATLKTIASLEVVA